MAVGRYETALSICSRAYAEMGQGTLSAVFASTDPNVILLRTLLNSCGRELGTVRPWRHLVKTGSITAAAAVAPIVYGVNALPTDWDYLLDETVWNATSQEPLQGPVDEVEWQSHLNTGTTPSPSLWRVEGNSLLLYDDSAGDTITMQYVSRYWVKPSGQTSPTAEQSTADADTLYHHPLLLTRLLKLRWKQARRFDTAAEFADFDSTLEMVASHERPAPVISLCSRY